jgi:hypothetical protein
MNLSFRSILMCKRTTVVPRTGFKLTAALLTVLLALHTASAPAQTPIVNGARTSATLALNTTNVYTFTATNGESIQVRMGAPFRPLVVVYAPNGSSLGTGAGSGSSSLDGLVQLTAATNGTFSIAVSSYYRNATGSYLLTLAKVPGSFVVSTSDEGGPLTNNAGAPGVIERGDIDLWSFEANTGDSILLRMGSPGYRPYFQVFNPRGVLLGTAAGGGSADTDAYISVRATNTGTFTVVAQSFYPNNNGPYTMHLVKAPGANQAPPGEEGGPMVNGAVHPGNLTLGDMDAWTFTADAGENIFVRVGAPRYRPWLHVYGPGGVLISTGAGSGSADRDATLFLTTTNSGTFTVVVQSYYGNLTGSYELSLAKTTGPSVVSPGDQGGNLVNGVANLATNSLGDIDSWTFAANTGDNISLRMGASDFRPWMHLFGPDGKLISESGGVSASRDANIFLTATNGGTFTVLVQSFYYNFAGEYTLHLAKVPGAFTTSLGDEGGALLGGVAQEGDIDLGDQDLWRFAMCDGEVINLRCLKLSGATFAPRIRLFGRNGALLATATSATEAAINLTTTNSGVYSVLVDGNALNHAGRYRLTGHGISDGLSLCVPSVSGLDVVLGGVGGAPGATFTLLTQTNVTAPFGQWAPILTNQFDSFGTFSRTYPINRAESERYFILQQGIEGD